ncbi:hypothetical protein LXA43DRAFT_1102041 [Ganoderma leucocontextum]|nr:hypothetical protein LXA43DRAFT_1102041 [Ganoderma leucocontextum]
MAKNKRNRAQSNAQAEQPRPHKSVRLRLPTPTRVPPTALVATGACSPEHTSREPRIGRSSSTVSDVRAASTTIFPPFIGARPRPVPILGDDSDTEPTGPRPVPVVGDDSDTEPTGPRPVPVVGDDSDTKPTAPRPIPVMYDGASDESSEDIPAHPSARPAVTQMACGFDSSEQSCSSLEWMVTGTAFLDVMPHPPGMVGRDSEEGPDNSTDYGPSPAARKAIPELTAQVYGRSDQWAGDDTSLDALQSSDTQGMPLSMLGSLASPERLLNPSESPPTRPVDARDGIVPWSSSGASEKDKLANQQAALTVDIDHLENQQQAIRDLRGGTRAFLPHSWIGYNDALVFRAGSAMRDWQRWEETSEGVQDVDRAM